MRCISRTSAIATGVAAVALVLAGSALGVKSGVWDGSRTN
jgi:hypothetical protein